MGQRLVIDLVQNDKIVAAVYFHWSAYFSSTIYELARLSGVILNAEKTGKDKLLAIVEELEKETDHPSMVAALFGGSGTEKRRGGVRGLPEELEAAKKLFPNHDFKTENVNRNEGLISFTQEGIQSFHDWEEGLAVINLDTHEIDNRVGYEPHPFVFADAEYETDEDGYEYVQYYNSGRISINGKICPVDSFHCTCESIQDLADFMERELKLYGIAQKLQ